MNPGRVTRAGHGPIGSSELGRAEEGPVGRLLDGVAAKWSIRNIEISPINCNVYG